MDLIAPNAVIMKTGFIQLGLIVVPLIIATLKKTDAKWPMAIWSKLNAPLISIILGEIWAILAWALFHAVPTVDDYFVVGLYIAAGGGLIASLVKDAADGSMKTASVSGVIEMREKNSSKGGIG